MTPSKEEIKRNLVIVANNKKLLDTQDPQFFRTDWETRSNGALVAIVYTWFPDTGPIAGPAVWMSHFEETPDERIVRAIDNIKENTAELWNQPQTQP